MLNVSGKFLALTALSTLALATTGCEQQDDRTLAAAQTCLDAATDAPSANACASKVAGMTSPASYLIRCSANFIAQGFTGDRIAKAYQRLSETGGSGATDPTLNLMTFLIFKNAEPMNKVDVTVNNCVMSGSKSMERLSRVAELASGAVLLGGLDLATIDLEGDPLAAVTAIKNALSDSYADIINNVADPVQVAALGQVAISAAGSLCAPGTSFSTNEVCATMNQAISDVGVGNPAGLAERLLELLKDK